MRIYIKVQIRLITQILKGVSFQKCFVLKNVKKKSFQPVTEFKIDSNIFIYIIIVPCIKNGSIKRNRPVRT